MPKGAGSRSICYLVFVDVGTAVFPIRRDDHLHVRKVWQGIQWRLEDAHSPLPMITTIIKSIRNGLRALNSMTRAIMGLISAFSALSTLGLECHDSLLPTFAWRLLHWRWASCCAAVHAGHSHHAPAASLQSAFRVDEEIVPSDHFIPNLQSSIIWNRSSNCSGLILTCTETKGLERPHERRCAPPVRMTADVGTVSRSPSRV